MTDELPTHPVEATLDRSDDRWVLRMERTLTTRLSECGRH